MATMAKQFKRNVRTKDGPPEYVFEAERRDPKDFLSGSVYDVANRLEEETMFEIDGYEPTAILNHIAEEIKIRIRITGNEIFKIGELLCKAKKVCQANKISFKEWISKNCKFSYETAINFMHTFKYCMGFRYIAYEIPPSILYKISQPSFPEELREFLFTHGGLESMSNGTLNKLAKKAKVEGIEAIEEEVEEIGKQSQVYHQTSNIMDMFEHLLRTLVDAKSRLENDGRYDFKSRIEGFQELPKEINIRLFAALEEAIMILKTPYDKSWKELREYFDSFQNKM